MQWEEENHITKVKERSRENLDWNATKSVLKKTNFYWRIVGTNS